VLDRQVEKHDPVEGYNLEAAKLIKPVIGDTALLLVGVMRSLAFMEEVLEKGYADFISPCRPFIREPDLVNKFKRGETNAAACTSCNRCIAAVFYNLPVKCYYRSFVE
jgi:2,4-dienoyl-CoA reductase-like NADH-dependent reductase (Old Yellow Enzyme family)